MRVGGEWQMQRSLKDLVNFQPHTPKCVVGLLSLSMLMDLQPPSDWPENDGDDSCEWASLSSEE